MGKLLFFLASFLVYGTVWVGARRISYVATSTENPFLVKKESTTNNGLLQHPEITEMSISSNISNRFATTLIVSKVKNTENVARETTFTIVLPDKAFISEFIMEVGGKRYKAYVKEKEEAKQNYDEAVQMGLSAGHVAVSARDSNKFTVSVNIEPESKVVFFLTYEELLQRKNDQYELVVNIHPGQIVKHLNVEVQINETRPLKFVRTPSLRSGNEISKNANDLDPSSDIDIVDSTALVKFNPDTERQRQFARILGDKESDGLSGQFIVQYDVERDPHGGEVLLQDGYFVHFFAPSDLKPLPKHAIFVLDSSGSMSGTKIDQVKDALRSILNELREQDILSIIDFGSEIYIWDTARESKTTVSFEYDYSYQDPFRKLRSFDLPIPTSANNKTLFKIQNNINNIYAGGGTNMIGALETALYLAKIAHDHHTQKKYQPIVVLLTDGEPNVGLGSTEEIINLVTRLNTENNNIPIFSLSFGEGANKEFLRKLSLKNQGFSRHIYEASDASLQLQEFYKQISSPLLSDVTFKYNPDTTEVTKTKFPIYFEGSEIIITGRYNVSAAPDEIARPIACYAGTGRRDFLPTVYKPVTSLERLWAYLTVKQTLDERELSDNKEELTAKALDLALRYSFVTDVTSLVVVKPNETKAVDTEDAYRAEASLSSQSGGAGQFGVPTLSMPIGGSYAAIGQRGYPASASYYGSASLSSQSGGAGQLGSPTIPIGMAGSSGAIGLRGYPGSANYGTASLSAVVPLFASSSGNGYTKGAPVSSGRYYPQYINYPYVSGSNHQSAGSHPSSLESSLPWLTSALNPNRTLTIGQNVYKLGDDGFQPRSDLGGSCSPTPRNATETGICSTLSQCPDVHSYLTDFSVYQQYFCTITDVHLYAGVCCPTDN